MEKPIATIAVDGSLYQKHPRVKGLLEKYTSMLAPERKVSTRACPSVCLPLCPSVSVRLTESCFVGPQRKFLLAEDGSGKGAGLVAAIAEKLRLRNNNCSL